MPAPDFDNVFSAIETLPRATLRSLNSYDGALGIVAKSVDLPEPFATWVARAEAHVHAVALMLEQLEGDSQVILGLIRDAEPSPRKASAGPVRREVAIPPARPVSSPSFAARPKTAAALREPIEDEVEQETETAPPEASDELPSSDELLDRIIAQDSLAEAGHKRIEGLRERLRGLKPRDPQREKIAAQIEKIESEIRQAFSQVSAIVADARLARAIQ